METKIAILDFWIHGLWCILNKHVTKEIEWVKEIVNMLIPTEHVQLLEYSMEKDKDNYIQDQLRTYMTINKIKWAKIN